jgi:hypothetical protein
MNKPHAPSASAAAIAAAEPQPSAPALYLAWAEFQRRQVSMAELVDFECHFLPLAYKGSSHTRRALNYARLFWRTLRLLRQRRPPRVWLQLPQMPLLWAAWLYRAVFDHRVQLIADCHNAVFKPPWSRWPLGVSMLARCDLVLVHNDDVLAQALALGVPAQRLRVLEDVPPLRDTDPRGPVPAAFAGRPHPWVLFAGSYGRDEPVAEVLRAAGLLETGVLALTGRLTNAAKNGHDIADPPPQAVLTDYVPVADFDALLSHCDVVLAFTKFDGIQLSVCNEALGFAKPMVMSDTPLLRGLFGHAAVAVDSSDPTAIARGIQRACAEPQRWTDAARALAQQRRAHWQNAPLRECLRLLQHAQR